MSADVKVTPRMDIPVDAKILSDLYTKIPDFRKAYDVDGMKPVEFDTYGATVRTLRGFISLMARFCSLDPRFHAAQSRCEVTFSIK